MTNEKFFSKLELQVEVKLSYQEFLRIGSVYRITRQSFHAPSVKLGNQSRQAAKVGLACYHNGGEKNTRFTKTELAQAWLDLMTVNNEMLDEIAEPKKEKELV